MSYFSKALDDVRALRLVVWTFIVFHASTAAVEILAFTQGVSAALWGNVALRALIIVLFAYYGLRRASPRSEQLP